MSAVAGLLSLSGANSTDLVGEYQESILVRNAKGMNAGTTLFGLMSKLNVEEAENTEYNWFERDPVRREISKDGADTAPSAQAEADSLVFQETAAGGNAWHYLAEGHVLRVDRTGEYILVTTTPTSNTVAVARAINTGVAGVLATYTLLDEDVLTIITLGKDEGATATRASYEEPEALGNYIQTFNSTVELTNAFKANKLRTDQEGPLRARRIQALEKIGKDIEMAFLLGVKRRQTGTNGYQYFTGGLAQAVDTGAPANALDGGGSSGVSLADFKEWLETFMVWGSDAKLALAGPKAYSSLSNLANEAAAGFRIMNQETVYGMNVSVINTPFGEIDLAFHPLLKEIPTYADWMFVVDLALIAQKSQEPLFLDPNIQTPGQDSYKEQYRAKLGLKLKFADAFGYAADLQKINV